jgi:hypothetical protein
VIGKSELKKETVLNVALQDAMDRRYDWISDSPAFLPQHDFSKSFDKTMSRILPMAGYRYVSVGSRRLRRALLVALIAVMILAMTAGGIAIQRALVHWNESQNDDAGTLDVTFDIEDPNQTLGEFHFIKPEPPEGYTMEAEMEHGSMEYEIQYTGENGTVIYYAQSGAVESTGLSIDNEDADFQETIINGYKGYAYYKDGISALYWSDGISFFQINGNCSFVILEEMAVSIK